MAGRHQLLCWDLFKLGPLHTECTSWMVHMCCISSIQEESNMDVPLEGALIAMGIRGENDFRKVAYILRP